MSKIGFIRPLLTFSILSGLYACTGDGDSGLDEDGTDFREEGEVGSQAPRDADNDTEVDKPDNGQNGPSRNVCAEQYFDIQYQPVNLMILLDMSGSMVTPDSKYTAARDAVSDMVRQFEDRFVFGFDTYPHMFYEKSCASDGPVWFDCDEGTGDSIVGWLETHQPVSGTGDPLLATLRRYLDAETYAPHFASGTENEEAYLLVLADGDDCCGPDGDYNCAASWSDALADVSRQLQEQGIRTIVVGYTRNADPEALEAVAKNGGSPFSTYIQALSGTALANALSTIAGTITSCAFDVDDPGPASDPDKVNFYFNDAVVPYNEGCASGFGWTWENDDHTTMRFCEQSCDLLNRGDDVEITAEFGCPVVLV